MSISALPNTGDPNWGGPLNSYIYNQIPLVVDNIAQLQTLNPDTLPIKYVQVMGYYEPGDGGGGLFRREQVSNDIDNGFYFLVNNDINAGRWVRIATPGEISVKWFGAKGDRVTDDYDAFNRAFEYARLYITDDTRLGLKIKIPTGRYRLSQKIEVRLNNGGKFRGLTVAGASMKTSVLMTTDDNTDGILRIIANGRTLITVQDLSFFSTKPFDSGQPFANQGTALEVASLNVPAEVRNPPLPGYPDKTEDYLTNQNSGDTKANSVKIKDVTIGTSELSGPAQSGLFNKGISIKYGWYTKVINCYVTRNESMPFGESIGIELLGCYDPTVSKSYVIGPFKYGIEHDGVIDPSLPDAGGQPRGDWEDGVIAECLIVGCQRGVKVSHDGTTETNTDSYNTLFVEPGYRISGCHMNCYEYDIYVSHQRQVKIYGNHLYSANRSANGNPPEYSFASSIIKIGQAADLYISDTIFGGPGYVEKFPAGHPRAGEVNEDVTTRSIWIAGEFAQHILISNNIFNAAGVAIYNESNVVKPNTTTKLSHIVVSNNIYYGRGVGNMGQSFGPQFDVALPGFPELKYVDPFGQLDTSGDIDTYKADSLYDSTYTA